MFFCSVCDTTYTITKNINQKLKGGKKLETSKILIESIIKETITPEELASIDVVEIFNNNYYKNLTDKKRITLQEQYKKLNGGDVAEKKYYFLCPSCGNTEDIEPQSVVFSKYIKQNVNIIPEDFSYKIYDNTLPRLKNYDCGNKQCSTYKNPKLKEAVFFNYNNSSNEIYVCCNCKFQWLKGVFTS